MKTRVAIISLMLCITCSVNSNASLYTNSYGSLILGPNDDGSSSAQNLGFLLNFFGNTYNQFYINNNGNITFGAPTYVYTPSPLNTQNTSPMIAPFWTDLDSRPSGSVYLQQLAGKDIITWSNMGYYSQNYTGTANFQLVLNDPNNIPVGEGVIGFFYGSMSSGTDSHNVTVGFGDGLASINPGEISVTSGSSSAVSGALNGTNIWFNVNNGTPEEVAPVPEPGTIMLVGAGLLGLAAYGRRRRNA